MNEKRDVSNPSSSTSKIKQKIDKTTQMCLIIKFLLFKIILLLTSMLHCDNRGVVCQCEEWCRTLGYRK